MKTIQSEEVSALGAITCYDCNGDLADAVLDESWIKCASCGSFRGFKLDGWDCSCGNGVFQLTKERVHCPNCGSAKYWKPSNKLTDRK